MKAERVLGAIGKRVGKPVFVREADDGAVWFEYSIIKLLFDDPGRELETC